MTRPPRDTIQDEKIQSFIDETLSPDEIVDKRIFLVRHGECEDEVKPGSDITKQKDVNTPLTTQGRQQIEETASYLLNILQDPTSTLVIEHNAKNSTRIAESLKIIKEKIGCALVLDDKGLDSLPPYGENDQMNAKLLGGAIHTEYYKQFKERLKNEYKKEIKNILLTVHKSTISNLENLFISKEMGFVTSYDYKHGEIREWDYNKKGRIINKYERRDILQINQGNIDKIIRILETDEVITQGNKVNIRTMDIIQLQNFVNACFRKNPELYEKYINHLPIFCIINSLQLGKNHVITQHIEGKLGEYGCSEKKEIFDLIKKHTDIIEVFFKLFFKEKNESNEYTTLRNYMLQESIALGDTQTLLMNYYENIYPLVQEVKSKSLDMRIRNGEDINIEFNFDKKNDILQSLLINTITISADIREEQIKHTIERSQSKFIVDTHKVAEIGLNSLVKGGETYTTLESKKNNMIYIETNSGGGKSMLLARINTKLKDKKFRLVGYKNQFLYNTFFPIYINLAGTKSVDNIIGNIETIKEEYKKQQYENYIYNYLQQKKSYIYNDLQRNKIIYMFDSLDESDMSDQDKEKFLKIISEFNNNIIITGRVGSISEKIITSNQLKDKIEKIILKDLSYEYIDEQAKNYFRNDQEKYKKFNDIVNKNSEVREIIKNPLILIMILNLIDYNQVVNFESIPELYEEISTMRLKGENEKKQESRKIFVKRGNISEEEREKDKIVNKRKKILAELAYANIFEGKKIDGNVFKNIEEKYTGIIPNEECLNLLFRKNNNQEYDFVHQSFKEFFAVKEFIKILSSKQGKDADDYLTSIISEKLRKIDYGTLKFLVDMVNIDSNKHLKKIIINYIMNNRYRNGDIQAKIIYILTMLDNVLFMKYISTIVFRHYSFNTGTLGTLIDNAALINKKRYTDFVKSLIKDENCFIKKRIIEVLQKMGGKENIVFIESFIKKEATDIDSEMIQILGKIGGEKNIKFIKSLKNNKYNIIRGEIIKILGKIGGEENVEFIKSFKNDEDVRVREKMVEVLGNIGGEENIEFIKKLKYTEKPKVKLKMIDILGNIGGEDNIEFIKSFKNDKSSNVIIESLGKIGGEVNIEFIKSFKNDKSNKVKIKVIETLGNIGGKENIEFIKSFKDDGNSKIRTVVIRILGKFGGEDNIEFIKSFKNDKDEIVRQAVIQILGELGGEDNIEFIKSFKDDESAIIRQVLIHTLGRNLGKENIKFIKYFKNDTNKYVRKLMILGLGAWGGEKEIGFIKSFKNDKSKEVIQGIINALSFGGEQEIEFIKIFKNNKNREVRIDLIKELGKFGGKKNIEFIKSFRNDKDEIVRQAVIQILGELGGEENLAFIKSMKSGLHKFLRLFRF